jgi:glyceraldehyde 3-phosphate dehydrogenase
LKIDVVIESTGAFTKRADALKHIKSGAKKVIVTAPLKDKPDITIVPGVNSKKLKKNHKLISVASCTTNCAASVAKVLNDNFGIKWAMLSTIHADTSSQSIVDSSDDKNRRKGRAALNNIIPTSTGASESVVEVLPELKGKIKALAMRVPVADGSIVDFNAELKKKFDVKKINSAFKKASKTNMKNIIEYSDEDLVSSDIIGNSHSAVFDSQLTEVQGNLVKVLAWYDNEYGYSCRVADVVKMLEKI